METLAVLIILIIIFICVVLPISIAVSARSKANALKLKLELSLSSVKEKLSKQGKQLANLKELVKKIHNNSKISIEYYPILD
jgi:cell division protein FtsL